MSSNVEESESEIINIEEEDSVPDLNVHANAEIFGDDWTIIAQNKLIDWRKDARKLSQWHDNARSKFTHQRDCLNIPIIALSGLTTVLLGIQSLGSASVGIIDPLSISTLCVSGVTTFISGVYAFYSPAERVQKHLNASNAYGSLVRQIDYTINLPPKKRPDVEVSYVQVTGMFDAIGGQAPPLPKDVKK
jgi:hypothetical protein